MQDGKNSIWLYLLFENTKILYAGYKDEFDDIFPLLSPMELNKFEFLLDEATFEATEFLEGYEKLPRQNLDQEVTKVGSCVDQVRSKKRGRP